MKWQDEKAFCRWLLLPMTSSIFIAVEPYPEGV
jgi:hypothetical protein